MKGWQIGALVGGGIIVVGGIAYAANQSGAFKAGGTTTIPHPAPTAIAQAAVTAQTLPAVLANTGAAAAAAAAQQASQAAINALASGLGSMCGGGSGDDVDTGDDTDDSSD